MKRKQLRKLFIKPTQAQIDEFNKLSRSGGHTAIMTRNDVRTITHTGCPLDTRDWFVRNFNIPYDRDNECIVFGLPIAAVLMGSNFHPNRVNAPDKEIKEKNYAVYIFEKLEASSYFSK